MTKIQGSFIDINAPCECEICKKAKYKNKDGTIQKRLHATIKVLKAFDQNGKEIKLDRDFKPTHLWLGLDGNYIETKGKEVSRDSAFGQYTQRLERILGKNFDTADEVWSEALESHHIFEYEKMILGKQHGKVTKEGRLEPNTWVVTRILK